MRQRTLATLALVAASLITRIALADPIVPVDQVRSHSWVTYDYDEPIDSATILAPDFDPFAYGNRHISSIEVNRMEGDLSARGWAETFTSEIVHNENSLFQVDFDLTEERSFVLNAALAQFSSIYPTQGSSRITLSSFDSGLGSFVPLFDYGIAGEFDLEQLDVHETGTLAAGRYRLYARAGGTGFIHSSEGAAGSQGSLSFAFSVPEPSTAPLLGLALVGLTAIRRTKRAPAP